MSSLALHAMQLSLQIACLTVAISTPPALVLATWLARSRWRGKVLVDALILLPLGLPPALLGLWLISGLGPQGPVSAWLHHSLGWQINVFPAGVVLAASIMTVPMMARMLRPAFEVIDPMLIPVARTLGASRWHAWLTVTLPVAAPAVVSAMALGLAAAWGESGATLMLASAMRHDAGDAPTAAVALWQALDTPAGHDTAWQLGGMALAVALLAVLVSELARARWRLARSAPARLAPEGPPA